MKRFLFFIFCIAPLMAFAAEPKPSNYNIPVHVQKSWLETICVGGFCDHVQHLAVLIQGRKYELADEKIRTAPLRIGDYKARTVKAGGANDYEDVAVYEILFSDGQTRKYDLVGEEE